VVDVPDVFLLCSWCLVRCGYDVGAYGLTNVRCWGFLVRLWGCPKRCWCDIGAMMFRYDIWFSGTILATMGVDSADFERPATQAAKLVSLKLFCFGASLGLW